jgi:AcrR family transcriptional regulator
LRDAAVRLFLERGYDAVTVADVAEAAETSVTTLFTYFPDGKEALVFAWEEDRAAALVAAVSGREDIDPLTAVEKFIRSRGPFIPEADRSDPVHRLMASTPALREYVRKKWVRCELALCQTLAQELGRPADAPLRALCRFLLEVPDIASQDSDPPSAVTKIFEHLRQGWL